MERKTYQETIPFCTQAVSDESSAVLIRLHHDLDIPKSGYLYTRTDYSNCGCMEVHTPSWGDAIHRDLLALYIITGAFGYGFPYAISTTVTRQFDGESVFGMIGGGTPVAGSIRNMVRLTYPAGIHHKTERFVRRIAEIIGEESVSYSNPILNRNSGRNIQCAIVDIDRDRITKAGKWDAVVELAAQLGLEEQGINFIKKEDK